MELLREWLVAASVAPGGAVAQEADGAFSVQELLVDAFVAPGGAVAQGVYPGARSRRLERIEELEFG